MDISNMQINSIFEFYNGKGVFITGGMGFLGKVLVEKLLRSYSEIENIYLLVRSKKVDVNDNELTTSQVFDTLCEKDQRALSKIIFIKGDTSKVELGISKENQKLLCDKVSVIIHSAAIVRFTEGFKGAVYTNLKALNELLKLSREMKNLKSFIHISTAYTNWFELDVKEKFYSAAFDNFYIIDLTNNDPDDKLSKMAPKFYGKHVNFYTLTKNFAETEQRNDAATKAAQDYISIVGSATGWIDVNTEKDLAIEVTWRVESDEQTKSESSVPVIYKYDSNYSYLKQLSQSRRAAWRKNPLAFMHWYPLTKAYRTRLLNYIDVFFTHFMPAVLTEMGEKLKEVNGKAVSSQVQYGVSQIKFFANNPMKFFGENHEKLFALLNKADQKNYFDPRTISLQNIFVDFYQGIRKIHPK